MWFQNPWIIVQLTSFSKWFSDLANHVPYVSRDSDKCRFVKLSLFFCLFVLFISVFTLKKLKYWSKTDLHSFVLCRHKNKRFSVISGFSFWALHPKTKTQKSLKFYKKAIILKCKNVASKSVEMRFKHQTKIIQRHF